MPNFEDSYLHKGLRKKLIDLLRKKLKSLEIEDDKVLQAMYNVPRHFFFDSALADLAYEDRAFKIDADQTISQPYTVAFQTHLLDVQKNEKILEIGTGSTYQSCVLACLGAKVYTIERQKTLFDKTKDFPLKQSYPSIKFFYGDGFKGLATFAPFDKILITAAAPMIPPMLWDQLKINGLMVLPLNDLNNEKNQIMIRLTKLKNDEMKKEIFDKFSFVPMLAGKAK